MDTSAAHMGRYRDLMLEIKERTLSIGEVAGGRTALRGPLAKEFCFLQLRMVCECIALSCLVAHGDLKEIQAPNFQKETAADLLMKKLEGLHPDFYPHPVRIEVKEQGVMLSEMTEPFLTKAELIKLVRHCGQQVHRGSIKKYNFSPTPQQLANDFAAIMSWANKILRLTEQHKVVMQSGRHYVLCILSHGPKQEVSVFTAGPKTPEPESEAPSDPLS
jgi:hypothetical protein